MIPCGSTKQPWYYFPLMPASRSLTLFPFPVDSYHLYPTVPHQSHLWSHYTSGSLNIPTLQTFKTVPYIVVTF